MIKMYRTILAHPVVIPCPVLKLNEEECDTAVPFITDRHSSRHDSARALSVIIMRGNGVKIEFGGISHTFINHAGEGAER